MFTMEERIALVTFRLHGLTYEQVREAFTCRFRKPAPTRMNIRTLVNKFQRTGRVDDEERSGRPSTSQETVLRIQEAIERSPTRWSTSPFCPYSSGFLKWNLPKQVGGSQRLWASRSPDLTPLDFLFGGS